MRSILQMLEFHIIRVRFSSVSINITILALPLTLEERIYKKQNVLIEVKNVIKPADRKPCGSLYH